jgi:hypothetical protein
MDSKGGCVVKGLCVLKVSQKGLAEQPTGFYYSVVAFDEDNAWCAQNSSLTQARGQRSLLHCRWS